MADQTAPVPAPAVIIPDAPAQVVAAAPTDALVDAWLRETLGNCPELGTPTVNRLREAGEALKARLR